MSEPESAALLAPKIRSLCGDYECGLCGTAKGYCCPVSCGADRCITDTCDRPASLAAGLIDDFNASAREQVEWERTQGESDV